MNSKGYKGTGIMGLSRDKTTRRYMAELISNVGRENIRYEYLSVDIKVT